MEVVDVYIMIGVNCKDSVLSAICWGQKKNTKLLNIYIDFKKLSPC